MTSTPADDTSIQPNTGSSTALPTSNGDGDVKLDTNGTNSTTSQTDTGNGAENEAKVAHDEEVEMYSIPKDENGTVMKTKSKYYHFQSTPAHLAEQYKPKPVSAEEAKKLAQVPTKGVSVWNAAGTWEELSVNDFALDRMKTLYTNTVVDETVDDKHVKISIKSCKSVKGEASIVFIRGKRKCSFDMKVELEWEGTVNDDSVEGTVMLPDIDMTNVDGFDIVVKSTKSDTMHDVAKKLLRQRLPAIFYERTGEFVQELLAYNHQ
uniref:Activator of Hsp90 ATPase AHSA1-like N-terminal domain-containing protein n=1 Tax=Lygus hesperus TaxID=30085 RepID=A0A0A9XVP9_LYGHE